jgi:hypothetical protein
MGSATWQTDDADGCAASGSVLLSNFGTVQQCVPATQNTPYYWGYRSKQATTDNTICYLSFYSDAGCTAETEAGGHTLQTSAVASSFTLVHTGIPITSPPGTQYALFTCGTWESDPSSVDQVYVNTVDKF